MVIDVFVAEGDGLHALGNERWQGVFNQSLVSAIGEALAELTAESQALVHLPEQKPAAIAREVPSTEIDLHFTLSYLLKSESFLNTVCLSLSGRHVSSFGLLIKD